MKKEKAYFGLMLICLVVVGVLQFFELPKIIDYILGVVAVIFAIIGYIVKFQKK